MRKKIKNNNNYKTMNKYLIILLSFYSITLFSQSSYDALSRPDTYRNLDNPNYWKNKTPNKDYWQQDVSYKINAYVDEKTDIISAEEVLTYFNNSPDKLDYVYFHLYQNAFQPDSYLSELQKQNGNSPKYGKYEAQKLGTEIEKISSEGVDLKTELDNTILKVFLTESLMPGESVTFNINFKTYFDIGDLRRRMKTYNSWGFKHYNGVHWYPRISVYDAKFGWTTDQHLGKEFYGDFGSFDVELNFSSDFVVGATGFLLNREEVLPKDLRAKLDIKNFKNKEWGSLPSVITEYNENERKIWKFHAENVHDFAFTADPTYRIGESWWKNKVCYSLAQEPHASKWQNAADFSAKVIEVFSNDIGMYTYHKMIVADARDGMEYPMITLDGGSDPGYRDLLAHEIGHNWFFGQIGNNETYRALLDEGFTQFLTAWAMIKIDGDYVIEDIPENKYKKRFHKPTKAIDSEIYNSYMRDATKFHDPVISTHSDGFNGALSHGGGYRHVYYKTAAMLYNLQYVLGDDLFLNAMKYYFAKWKIAHPYTDDFRDAIIEYTKVDLNWFFDQWLESKKRIDYSVSTKNKGGDKFNIRFKRKSRMQMPIDFTIISNDLKVYNYHIPNTWFIKKTDATILAKWHGWDLLYPEYNVELEVPTGIKEVIIDPSNRLADAYMPDNNSKNNISYTFDHNLWQSPDWTKYEVKYRPDIWWNNYDGMKLGFNIKGGYLNHHHLFDASAWINTSLLQQNDISNSENYNTYSYKFNYNSNIDNISLNTRVNLNTEFLEGLYVNSLSLNKYSLKKNYTLSIKLLSLYRTKSENYLLYPELWDTQKLNNRIDVSLKKEYKYKNGKGSINLSLQSSAIGSDYDYQKFIFSNINSTRINKLKIKSRLFMQIGSGDNWAKESMLHLAGANNEELMNSKYTRSTGFIPQDYVGFENNTNHFHAGGGLNLRGYAGYLVPDIENRELTFNYQGTSGASINIEIDYTNYLPNFLRKTNLSSYVFADAGSITNESIKKNNIKEALIDVRADAGLGFTYSFRSFSPLETIRPLTIRLDLPLILNMIPEQEDSYINMRWLIGINKTF